MTPKPIFTQIQTILEKGLWLNNTRMGNVQLLNSKGSLEIIAQKGFSEIFLKHFHEVKLDTESACARAFALGEDVRINDISKDESFAPHRFVAASAGFRAVVSHPLITDGRVFLGTLSMHFPKPRYDWSSLCITPAANEMIRLIQNEMVAA